MIKVFFSDDFQTFPIDFFSKTLSPEEFPFNGAVFDPDKVTLETNSTTGKTEIVLGMALESDIYKAGCIKTGGKLMPTPPLYVESKLKLPAYAPGVFPAFWMRDWKVNSKPSWQIGEPIRVFGKPHDVSWDPEDSVNEFDIFEQFGANSNWPSPALVVGWHLWRPEYGYTVSPPPSDLSGVFLNQPLTKESQEQYHTYGASIEFYDPADRGQPLRKAKLNYYFDGDLMGQCTTLWNQERPHDIIWNMGRHDSGDPPEGLTMKIASIGIYLLEEHA